VIRRFVYQVRAQPMTAYAIAVVIGFVAFTLGPALLGMRTLISVHLLTGYLPWRANGAHTPSHEGCTGDTIDAVMPQIAYIRDRWFSGHLGSWQSLVAGGSPAASLPDAGLLDPLSLPYLVLPLWLAPAFVKLCEFAAAIGGTFLFLRRVGASRAAGLLAGIVFAASGFMVVWTNWPQTRVAALIPLLFWGTERLVQRHRRADVAITALVVASMLLGGFPTVTGYALYFAALYLLTRVVQLHRADLLLCVRIVGAGVGAIGLGVMVAAIQILPFADFYSATDFSYRVTSTPRFLTLSTLLTVVAPESHGLCAGTVKRHGQYPIEAVTFVGAAAILLAVGGAAMIWRRSRSIKAGLPTVFLIAVVLTLLLGWGGTPLLHAVNDLPVFSGNFVGRIRSVLGFFLAVLAGFGFDALLRARGRPSLRPRRTWIRPTVVWTAAALLGAAILWRSYVEARDRSFLGDVRPTLTAPAILFVIAAVVCVAALSGSHYARIVAAVVLPLLIAGQSATFVHRVIPGDRPSDFYPVTAAHRFLIDHVGTDRYDASALVFYPATSLYYGIRAATGHSFTDRKWMALLTAIDPGRVRRTPTFSAFTRRVTPQNIGHSPALDRLSVKYFAFGAPSVSGTSAPATPADGRVAAAPDGTVSCSMPGGSLRGLTMTVGERLVPQVPLNGVTLHATIRAGDTTVSAGRFLAKGAGAGQAIQLAVAGENLPPNALIRVTFTVSGATGPLSLAAAGRKAICTPIRPIADKLRLVYADPSVTIYQRLTALPRIRWSSRAIVVTDLKQQISAIAAGVSSDTVVLGKPGPTASGGSATVSVDSGNGDRISASVDAAASGYLTVADAMQQPGWVVTVDGKRARLVPADAALAAVAVPAGTHRVVFTYHAPGQRLGAVVTFGGLSIVVGLFIWDDRIRRRRPRRARQAGGHRGTASSGDHDAGQADAGR
jgi:hypothetical protein